ncbi:guanylate-binding protein 4 isoform X4 [Tupaia chinensis]|uniref:guanylate-binding protein 4 isoform X4 n=1 Tax=Tupaia chinensis TaxID=246437 RepID=UPI000FFC5F25|nr:guanylate-binding protein 4 isoform X4 [Tupaia chinensis]
MATGPRMMAPICLVENEDNRLKVNSDAINILERTSEHVVIVAIVGLYRTGKSYLMNRLAGQNHGFPLGSTVRSETKGIWMWCVPHPLKPNHTLVLLDTEGLGDIEKGDPTNDSWIFALAVLLSSTFVYNSMGTINHQALDQLHYVAELSERIRAKSSPQTDDLKDSAEFAGFFPDFVWTVRDFTLELELDGHPITEDEYLENALKLIKGLATLVVTYVDAINSGAVPCLENAVTTLAQRENSAAVQKAANHYREQMAQRLRLPTDTLQELLDVHAACEKEAIAVFMELSFKDENQEFQKELVIIIEKKKEDFLLQNEEASIKYCKSKLEHFSEPLMKSISGGNFSVPGGYNLYLEAKKKVECAYNQVPRKGVKANEVLQGFLQSLVPMEDSILQSDKALTAGEKAIAEEQAKKEAAEKEQELLRQKQKEQEQRLEAQERSHQEHIHQLKEKMEKEKEDFLREQDRVLEHKMRVQREMLIEGFEKKSEELNKEIKQLKAEIERKKEEEPSGLLGFFATIGKTVIDVVTLPFKLAKCFIPQNR